MKATGGGVELNEMGTGDGEERALVVTGDNEVL